MLTDDKGPSVDTDDERQEKSPDDPEGEKEDLISPLSDYHDASSNINAEENRSPTIQHEEPVGEPKS